MIVHKYFSILSIEFFLFIFLLYSFKNWSYKKIIIHDRKKNVKFQSFHFLLIFLLKQLITMIN